MSSNLKLISILEAADIMGVSKRTVDRLIASGELSIVKINRSSRILFTDLEKYIDRNTYTNKALA